MVGVVGLAVLGIGAAFSAAAGYLATMFPKETKGMLNGAKDFFVDPKIKAALERRGEDTGVINVFKETAENKGHQLKAAFGNEESKKKLPPHMQVKTPEERAKEYAMQQLDKHTNGLASNIANGINGGDPKKGDSIIDRVIGALMNKDGGFNFGMPLALTAGGGALAFLTKTLGGPNLFNPALAIPIALAVFTAINWNEVKGFFNNMVHNAGDNIANSGKNMELSIPKEYINAQASLDREINAPKRYNLDEPAPGLG